MNKVKMTISKRIVLALAIAALVLCFAGCNMPTTGKYGFINAEPVKPQTDPGFKIDGILDEEAYKNTKWLYFSNNAAGNNVNVGVTSYYGEQGMYFVYDVTESAQIYVNPNRSSVVNSGIEMYLAPGGTKNNKENNFFEIDLMPDGQMKFKMSNGKWGYVDVRTTNDKMAQFAATTKGGPVNTEECYGYYLELFIPWAYMEWLDVDVAKLKDHALVNVAHITSFNYTGKDHTIDRFWYSFADQLGGTDFNRVSDFFKFNGEGAMNTMPITLEKGEHYTISGTEAVLSGMNALFTVTPEAGHAITSILVNGKEYIEEAVYNKDGSMTLVLNRVTKEMTVSAATEAISSGNKVLSGQLQVHNLFGDTLAGATLSCIGPNGEVPIQVDEKGNFELKDLPAGYYELVANKTGYNEVVRGVFLSENTYVEVALKREVFYYTNTHQNWNLDNENSGVLYKEFGRAHILSKDSYNDFVFEAMMKFDKDLAASGSGANCTEQRTGMQIVFSNGKQWHINLLWQGGNYGMQYAAFAGDGKDLFGWTWVKTLSAEQVAKYQSAEGIKMKIVRQGNVVSIYLDDVKIKTETLDASYAEMTAQIGLDAWIDNPEPIEIPFSISTVVS